MGLPYQYTVHQALQIMQIHPNGLMKSWPPHSGACCVSILWHGREQRGRHPHHPHHTDAVQDNFQSQRVSQDDENYVY